MNLCFFSDKLQNTGDGKNLTLLLRGLHDMGHEISIILLDADRTPDDYDFHKIFPVKFRGNKISAFKKQKAMIQSIIQEHAFDLLVSFGVAANVATMFAVKGTKIPTVLCERNDPNFVPENFRLKLLRNMVYPFASAYVFQTEEQKNYFSEKIQRRSFVIPNFVGDVPEPADDLEKELSVATHSRLDNTQKNLFMLFDAFSEFAKSHPEYTLKVYGDGPDKEKCAAYIHENGHDWNIKLMGEPENLLERLQQSEMFVLTSNYEGMPNTLLEAMSMGMTCISTNCGGANVLIENGKNGVLVSKNDTTTLCEALCFLADNPEIRNQFGQAAYHNKQRFSAHQILPLWDKAFHQIKE